ncbi:hypothetical protein CDAR_231381 [Caerostris darwini]|uniref:Uncharacterized protein n=1 Tax=Caerostris darwini TaxID=1538125 RepID=A0AAV4WW69_9ARAC|nr:hypothetical protein CDAR_231381 [Caerostris darwini]
MTEILAPPIHTPFAIGSSSTLDPAIGWRSAENRNDKTILNRINKNIKINFKNNADKILEDEVMELQRHDGSLWGFANAFKNIRIKVALLKNLVSMGSSDEDKKMS